MKDEYGPVGIIEAILWILVGSAVGYIVIMGIKILTI